MTIKIILFYKGCLDINHKDYFMFDIKIYVKYSLPFTKWQTENINI